jgi:hypothetical protein
MAAGFDLMLSRHSLSDKEIAVTSTRSRYSFE